MEPPWSISSVGRRAHGGLAVAAYCAKCVPFAVLKSILHKWTNRTGAASKFGWGCGRGCDGGRSRALPATMLTYHSAVQMIGPAWQSDEEYKQVRTSAAAEEE